LDQGARLLGAGGHDPARPVVLEAPPDQMHAVGKERRRQRVAGVAAIGSSIEAEIQRTRAVDPAAFRQSVSL
jgi:hypothetical protein